MKKIYLALFAAFIAGTAAAHAAAGITGLNPVYSKDSTIYTGSNPDTLVTGNPLLETDGFHQWTIAFTVTDLAPTSGSDVGILFTYSIDGTRNYAGMGYQLDAGGNLTLAVGGWDYTGSGSGNSPWKTTTITGWSPDLPLTLFFTFNGGNVTISSMLGDDESSFISNVGGLNGNAGAAGKWLEQINFSAIEPGGGAQWGVPNGVNGQYTLNNFDIYMDLLSDAQKKEYARNAADAIPEPASATLGLLGFAALITRRHRRR